MPYTVNYRVWTGYTGDVWWTVEAIGGTNSLSHGAGDTAPTVADARKAARALISSHGFTPKEKR